MKISKMIQKLKKIQKKYGDIDCVKDLYVYSPIKTVCAYDEESFRKEFGLRYQRNQKTPIVALIQ